MSLYIDLQRHFRDLTNAELEDPEFLASLNDRDFVRPSDWSQLLKHKRVLLLAEAGSGKTTEMREQARRLLSDGKFAFFVALESLDRGPLVDVLSNAEEKFLDEWKADARAPAWFFLDAVDELKLTEGNLDRALQRFSKAIDGHLDRARVLISCRPNDWRSTFDMATLESRLPLPTKRPNPILPADEMFINALRLERGESLRDTNKEQDDPTGTEVVRTVILLPMSSRQIKLFAKQYGVHNASTFVAEINREDAWTFARRPLDLSELITTWNRLGRLGTRTEQHEGNIAAKLKDDPNRRDRSVLSDAKCRLGAERLALALALTRTRTIRSPEHAIAIERAEGVLDPATILRDWTEGERQALLRRALFDPATYGRVRFHHRSVQEYLAACHLRTLRDKGMSRKALFRLLFAAPYGEEVVLPSMRPIAAWLALWDNDVRRELMKREPEALLSFGDPASLRLGVRAELVRAFAMTYGEGGSRGLGIPREEVGRLSAPELGPVIRELWGSGPINPDVRQLLIELIWKGPIKDCADLAQSAALDTGSTHYHRIAAVLALLACGCDVMVRGIAEAILLDPAAWPDKTIFGLSANLFPKIISVDELVLLMERTREPQQTTGGFGWVSRQIVESVESASASAVALRDKMAELIWRGRKERQDLHHLWSRFGHLAPALAMLCERRLVVVREKADSALIRCCVIASRFGGKESGLREAVSKLAARFQEHDVLREAVFAAEMAFIDELAPTLDAWNRLYHIEYESLIGRLTEVDRPWLEGALANKIRPERRPVVLHALLDLWRQRGGIASELDPIRALVGEDSALKGILAERTTAPTRNFENERIERSNRRRQIVEASREEQRLQEWKKWREELLAYPDKAFAPDKRLLTVANFHTWLSAFDQQRTYYAVWNKEALTKTLGADIANRAADAFKSFWRATPPILWSERTPEERNSTLEVWLYGLCGMSAEASTPGWAMRLSPDEARIAIAYATVDLDGFAPFISELTVSRPEEVDSVLGIELRNQLNMGGDHNHLPLLQDLTHAEDSLKRLLAPRLLEALPNWPTNFTAETGANWAQHLEYVLGILEEIEGDANRRMVADVCAERFEADQAGPLALVWLRGLFRFDPRRGTQALTAGLAAEDDPVARRRAIEIFSNLFGDGAAFVFKIENVDERARVLGSLVRSAYAFIHPEDDEVHEGVYTPNARDRAEAARSFLLSALLETPGPEARRIILELATEPNFEHFPDRLRLLARQRAATDAEFPAFDAEDMADLESSYEAPPRDRNGLFRVTMDRLEDLAHDLTNDDFTNRRTLATISDEIEMQRTLASRIKSEAKGAFVVTREDEVADRKRTDIRLTAVRGDQKAVIEVKLADDRYSLADLELALYDQLIGQYLRHEKCKAGVLLLTYNGSRKGWKHPISNNDLKFADLIDYLNEKARVFEIDNQYTIRVAVFGLDLTDPPISNRRRGH